MASTAEGQLWQWLREWGPGQWFGHGPPPSALQMEKAQGGGAHGHEAAWGELGSRDSPTLLTCSNVNPNRTSSHLRKSFLSRCRLKPSGKCKPKPQCKFASPRHPTRMATINKSDNSKCSWWGRGEITALTHCRWECKIVQPLWKTVGQFFKI